MGQNLQGSGNSSQKQMETKDNNGRNYEKPKFQYQGMSHKNSESINCSYNGLGALSVHNMTFK